MRFFVCLFGFFVYLFLHSFDLFSKNKSRRCDDFGPKIGKNGDILAIFRPFKDFWAFLCFVGGVLEVVQAEKEGSVGPLVPWKVVGQPVDGRRRRACRQRRRKKDHLIEAAPFGRLDEM